MHVTVYERFRDLPVPVRSLFEQAQLRDFYSGTGWYQTLEATALPADAGLRIYVAWEGNEDRRARVALVLQTPGALNGSRLGGALARGRTLSGAHNFHTCLFGPVLAADLDDARPAIWAICEFIAQEHPRWEVIELNALDAQAPSFEALCTGLQSAGFAVRRFAHFGSWFDRFDQPSYRDYTKKRGAALRKAFQNYERKARKLQQLGKVEFVLYSKPEELDRAFEAYRHIISLSWKDEEHNESLTGGMFRAAADIGALRLGILFLDGQPIATEVGIVIDGTATMVKTAYVEARREASPGAIVILYTLERLLAEGVKEINFGRDDQDYKRLWLAQRRERWAIAAYRRETLRGMLMCLRHDARIGKDALIELVKPLVKPVRDAWRMRRTAVAR